MNKVILMGRLTRDPEIRTGAGANATAIARYTLAVDRKFKREGEAEVDFISCVAFGRSAEFAEKYLHQGTKIAATGRIRTGSYQKNDGTRVYTTDVIIEDQEFAESRNVGAGQNTATAGGKSAGKKKMVSDVDGFMQIPDEIDEELPFR